MSVPAFGFRHIAQAVSWNELKAISPANDGDTILLTSYQPGLNYGGGLFVARMGKKDDDGGTICKIDDGCYWERIIQDANDIDVTHFGAVKDGKTDCLDACTKMLNWSIKLGIPFNNIGIQFPSGIFALSNLDISTTYISAFRFTGKPVSFGYYPTTRIVLMGKDNTPALKVNARKTEIAHINIYGQTDKQTNTRGFYQNICKEGEFVHASYWRAENVGGVLFDMLDTLDTRFEEWYVTKCSNTVIQALPSNSATGAWYHTTAIELSNFNVQNHTGPNGVFNLSQCTQSFIKNGWIEKTENPGTLDNGQWLIDGLSLEDCKKPLNLSWCQVMVRALNTQSGSTVVYNASDVKECNPYERGYSRQEAYGFQQWGSMAFGYKHANIRFNNTTDKPKWFCVGTYTVVDDNDITLFKVVGGNSQTVVSADKGYYNSNNFGGGSIEMVLRRIPGSGTKQDGAITVNGKSPLLNIACERPWEKDITIYIQLPANSGWVNCHFETTAHSRFTNGTPFCWKYDGNEISDTDFAKKNVYYPRNTTAIGTLKHGMAIMEDGTLHYTTKDITDNKLTININGTYYTLPVTKLPYMSDGFNRTGNVSGRNLDNSLGGILTSKWGNWGLNNGANCNNGSLNLIQKSKAFTGFDTTLVDNEITFKVISGPKNTGTDISTAFEFRRSNWNMDQVGYSLAFTGKDTNNNNGLQLYSRTSVNGVMTLKALGTPATIKDGQTLKVVTKGNVIQIFADAVLIMNITDNSVSVGSYVGFAMYAGNQGMIINELVVSQA